MFTQDISNLTRSQINAIDNVVQIMDDLVEATSTFVLKGGQGYRAFLEIRKEMIESLYNLPMCK